MKADVTDHHPVRWQDDRPDRPGLVMRVSVQLRFGELQTAGMVQKVTRNSRAEQHSGTPNVSRKGSINAFLPHQAEN